LYTPACRCTEIEYAYTVLGGLDLGQERALESDELDCGEIADKYRVLKRLTMVGGNAMHPPQPTRLAYVVGHEIACSFGHGGCASI
jgi:hypothetical protein